MSKKNDNIGLAIQARMDSKRLPGKVLMGLCGGPILWHIINRLKCLSENYKIVVITTIKETDNAIEKFCEDNGVLCFRGSEDDVLDRYYQAAKRFELRHIVRLTADNPLVDPDEIDRLINLHLEMVADYTTNKDEVNSGLPIGVGAEIFSFAALEKSWQEGKAVEHREHVNEYILENRDKFDVHVLKASKNKYAPELRLTVDTKKDFDFMESIYSQFFKAGEIVSVEDVINYVKNMVRAG